MKKTNNLNEVLENLDLETIRDNGGQVGYYIAYLLDSKNPDSTEYYDAVKYDMTYILHELTDAEHVNELYQEIYEEIEKSMDDFITNNYLDLIEAIKEYDKDEEEVKKLIDIILNDYVPETQITLEDLDKAREYYGEEYDEKIKTMDTDYFDIPIIRSMRYFD